MKVRGANYFSVHTAGEELWSVFLTPMQAATCSHASHTPALAPNGLLAFR
jgi:hypothetical protein